MGYIKDLQDECLKKFKIQLEEVEAENKDEVLFQMDFSVVSFSCSLKDGYKMIHKLNHTIKILKKKKYQLITKINEECANLDMDTEQWRALSRKEKKKFANGIRRILLSLTDEYDERIKKLKKMRRDTLLRTGNIFLYIFTVLLAFGLSALLYLDKNIINIIVYPVSLVSILGFITIQVLYTVKYLKAIDSTIRGIIDFSIKRAFSTLLVIWWYIFLLAIVNEWNTNIVMYSFMAIFSLYIIFLIFDVFLSSRLFDETESALSLMAAITIGVFCFTDSINNIIVKQIGFPILFIGCFLLHILIIKKFILDKQPIKDILGIMYVVLIIVATIILTIVAFYKLLWRVPIGDQVVDNTLFAAVTGIYASILGGGLTLAGVAWTIKHNESQRKDEEKATKKPYLILDEVPLEELTADKKLNVITDSAVSFKTVFMETEIFVANNADCIFNGIILDNKYYKPSYKKYMKQGFWYFVSELRLAQSIKTDNFYLIVQDLLGNFYKYECFVKEDAESNPNLYYNYVCNNIGLPQDLTKEENLLINSVEESAKR